MARWVAPILAYHSVHPQRIDPISITPAAFAEQLAWLARQGYQGVSLATWLRQWRTDPKLTKNLVALTFDDGYLDNLAYAWPLLEKFGFGATIFVIANGAGTTATYDQYWLDHYPSVPAEIYRYLTWDDIRFLRDKGIEIGSHTCNHPMLDQLSVEQQAYEIGEAKQIIEAQLGHPIESFCYPAGHFNDASLPLVKQAGYRQAVVTPWREGLIRGGEFTIKRVGIYHSDTGFRFSFKVSPLFELVRQMKHWSKRKAEAPVS
ncbi:MAG: polysaccharide deacetylase family protein [Caldilineaceae bacterium]